MLKKRIKYSALMMNLLMLSTPVLISVVEVAANEQQSVNEENAHVNIEGMSTMEEVPRTSEDMDTEEGNDPMMKESENEKTKKQSEEANEEWKGVVFGESTSASRYAIEPLEDGVRLSSTNNGGKFQSSGSDGMTYYYQAIPKDINFRMRATIEIESWTYTNAQEGFALMVRDAVPKDHLFGQAFYSNSFAILGSRIEYVWDSDRQEVVNTSGSKYTMRLGLGTRAITANREFDYQTKLMEGTNEFTFSFTPDKNYPPEEYVEMASYETKEILHTVDYRKPNYSTVYVTPEGSDTGNGSRQNPLSLTQALRYAYAGQTIVLAPGTYSFERGLTIPKGVNGTRENPIQLIAEKNPENKRPVLDFKGTGNGMTLFSHYWVLRGFDVTNSAAMQKGLQISGNHNLIEEIHAYRNGNTGIQISGSSNDPFEAWPAHNLVKNCTSFENADPGFEDADGFAAKLTIGEGNVFDGCIAYHNADDGWDLFAKNETGSIGKVVIKNSVAYRNGWVPGVEGEGNGNGFKMGGSSLSGPHELINSLSFENLAKGIDSNSGTDIIVNSSTSFNNGSYNVALYTFSAGNTDFHASGILSFRTENLEMREQIRPLNQNEDQIYHSLNYYWNEREKQSENTLGHTVSKDWIESLNTHSQEGQQPVTRYANGSIHVHGLMQIKPENRQTEKGRVDGLPLSVGATFDGETSPSSEYPEYAIVQEPNQTKPNEQNNPIIIQEANGVAENAEGNIIELKPFTVFVSTFTPNQGTPVFEDMRYFPEKIQIVETQSSAQFSNHTAIFSAPSKGEYTLEVTYRSEIFDGEKWSAHTESVTQQKAITVRETADVPPGNDKPERENPGNESPNGKPNGKPSHPDRTAKESEKNGTQGLPKTGEFNNPLLALAGGILLIGVVVYVMKQRKK
ncbi:right-handed parallel beta-helix repeat-containing protein [Enterococcus faecium]|uniref:right-handed parallel beta-helix repeat-containing protein n=1 Tax=Enterococcus faecium TaxID=1352 RepID=UPI003CE470FC